MPHTLPQPKAAYRVSLMCVGLLGLMLLAETQAEAQSAVLADSVPLTTASARPVPWTARASELAHSSGGEWLFKPNDWFRSEPEETLTLPLPSVPTSVVQRPLIFERNDGQTAAEVAFLSRGRGYSLFLAKDEAVMVLSTRPSHGVKERLGLRQPFAAIDPHKAEPNAPQDWRSPEPFGNETAQEQFGPSRVLRMRLVGANSSPAIRGEALLPSKANYFIGNDPTRWRTNVPTFGKVRYEEVYPGVDLVYYGNEGRLEYDFVVASGGDPNQIAMEFEGADALRIQEGGDLVLDVGCREVRWQKPLIYQEANGKRLEIAGNYRIRQSPDQLANVAPVVTATPFTNELPSVQFVCFELAAYDRSLPLVIDPILVYSTYLGGSGNDGGHGVAVDGQGNVYVAGPTASTDFPTKNALNNQSAGGQNDVFVAKFNPAGELLFSSYLGGSGDDGALFDVLRIAVSPSDECHVVGGTDSVDFPLADPVQNSFGGGAGDAFVTALKADGSALTFSTYLGGGLGDGARNVAFGPTGDVYVVGSTFSADFPITNAFQPEYAGDRDAFITRFEAGGKRIAYSTFYGASATREWAFDVVVDADGNAYTVLWVAHTINSGYQWLIVKFSPDGSNRLFERRWPSSLTDTVGSRPLIALAPNDTVVVAGSANGTKLPAINQPNPSTSLGYSDCYIALFSATNGNYLSAAYLGGSGDDLVQSLCVDAAGELIVAGVTDGPGWEASGFPVTDPMESGPDPGKTYDVFVAKFRPSDLNLTFSTLFGGAGDEVAVDMALDARGNPWVAGVVQLWRTNAQLPTLNAFQPQPGGGDDAFLVNLSLRDLSLRISRSGQNVTLCWSVEAANYILEATTTLPAVSWETVTNTPTVTASELSVQLPLTGTARFFRLRRS